MFYIICIIIFCIAAYPIPKTPIKAVTLIKTSQKFPHWSNTVCLNSWPRLNKRDIYADTTTDNPKIKAGCLKGNLGLYSRI